MTVKQKQWQLYLLGYLDDRKEIDGLWGPRSREATLAFQKAHFPDKTAWDGIFGPGTEAKSREIIDSIQDAVTAYTGITLINDGLAGQRTMDAVKDYQKAMGLRVTGIVDRQTIGEIRQWAGSVPDETNAKGQTGTFWDEIEFFTEEEFRCKCGGRYCSGYPARMREEVVRICDNARRYFGRPGHIVSGLRCRTWNTIQGGVGNSQHLYGEAVDLRIEGITSDELMAFLATQPHRYSYRINGTNVHVDIPKGKR